MEPTLTENENLLRDAFERAPRDVQEFIELGGFDEAVAVLRKESGLDAETAYKAEMEILMALLGATNARDLEANLMERTGLSAQQLAPTMAIAVAYVFGALFDDEAGNEINAALPTIPVTHELAVISKSAPTTPRVTGSFVSSRPATTYSAAPVSESPLSSFHANLAPAPQVVAATPPPAPVPPTKAPTKPASATMHPMETFHARTMASDIEAMGGAQKMSAAPVRPMTPPPAPPRYAPIAATEPVPTPTPEPAPLSAAQSVHTDLKEYGIDPYREPIA